jgi:hypothetical protein
MPPTRLSNEKYLRQSSYTKLSADALRCITTQYPGWFLSLFSPPYADRQLNPKVPIFDWSSFDE